MAAMRALQYKAHSGNVYLYADIKYVKESVARNKASVPQKEQRLQDSLCFDRGGAYIRDS